MAPIVWRANNNERARMLGGQVLSGFQKVTNADVRARLDESARDRILQADLLAQGIQDFGELKSRGFGRPTLPSHCELFFGGRLMTLARWPNAVSWERIKDFPKEAGVDDGHGTNMGSLSSGFFYESGRPE